MDMDIDESTVYEQENMFGLAFPVMQDIRRQGKLCDVTLRIDDQEISGHRIILAATIPYFRAMFVNDMLESKRKDITMSGIDACALETLVNFAYNGRINIDGSNVQSLMVGASYLQMTAVRDACADYIMKRLSSSSVLGVRGFADQLSHTSLHSAADKFIQRYFKDVIMSDDFLSLDVKDLTDIIRSDQLHIRSEACVFEGVMRWVKKDDARRQHLPTLLTQVRMPLLSPHYLTDRVAKEEVIRSCHKCRDLVDEARDYHLMPERRPLLPSYKLRPRCCESVPGHIFAIGGLAKTGDSLSTVEAFDPVTRKWELAEAMSMLRSRVGVAVLKNCLYAVGGYNGVDRLSTVEVFDPIMKSWSQVSPMHCKRSAMGAATLKDYLYVCGGYDGVTSLSSVERYSADLDKWTLVAPMLKHRSAGGVVAYGGYIFALGGHDGLSIFDLVERYDPESGQWSEMTAMLTKRCRLGVAALNDCIYVAGGYDGSTFLQTVEMFDPSTNIWKNVAPMHTKRSRVALVANAGLLWAIGGYDGVTNLSSVEVYDPAADKWTFIEPMVAHEGGVGVGVIPLPPM